MHPPEIRRIRGKVLKSVTHPTDNRGEQATDCGTSVSEGEKRMDTTTITSNDEGRNLDVAVCDAISAVEELLKRPKEQSLFEAGEIIRVLDRADFAGSLAATAGGDSATLAEVCAAGRAKATNQPILDANAAKGGLLLDLWDALSSLKASQN